MVGGLILLGLELFVVPGFGIAGALGIAALLAGFTLSLFGSGTTWDVVLWAAGRVVFSLIVAIVASLVMLRYLPRLPFGRRLVLETGLSPGYGASGTSDRESSWVGKVGTAISPLRPAGIADIEGERVDVVSDGEFIEPDTPVVVTRVDGNRVVVRRRPAVTERSET